MLQFRQDYATTLGGMTGIAPDDLLDTRAGILTDISS